MLTRALQQRAACVPRGSQRAQRCAGQPAPRTCQVDGGERGDVRHRHAGARCPRVCVRCHTGAPALAPARGPARAPRARTHAWVRSPLRATCTPAQSKAGAPVRACTKTRARTRTRQAPALPGQPGAAHHWCPARGWRAYALNASAALPRCCFCHHPPDLHARRPDVHAAARVAPLVGGLAAHGLHGAELVLQARHQCWFYLLALAGAACTQAAPRAEATTAMHTQVCAQPRQHSREAELSCQPAPAAPPCLMRQR